jgi:hypothetical protein
LEIVALTCRYILSKGWGLTETRRPSDVLKQVNIDIKDFSYCKSKFRRDMNEKSQICAGDVQEVKDSCRIYFQTKFFLIFKIEFIK